MLSIPDGTNKLRSRYFPVDATGIFQGGNPAVLSVARSCRSGLATVTRIPRAHARRLLQPLSRMSGQVPSRGS